MLPGYRGERDDTGYGRYISRLRYPSDFRRICGDAIAHNGNKLYDRI